MRKWKDKSGSAMITTLIIILLMSSVTVFTASGISNSSEGAGEKITGIMGTDEMTQPELFPSEKKRQQSYELIKDIEEIGEQVKEENKQEIIEEVQNNEELTDPEKEEVTDKLEEEVLDKDEIIPEEDTQAIEDVLIKPDMTEEEIQKKKDFARKLIHDIENRWGRPSKNQVYQLKGDHRVTWDDLSVLYLYATTYDGIGFGNLNEPTGIYKDVLISYKLMDA